MRTLYIQMILFPTAISYMKKKKQIQKTLLASIQMEAMLNVNTN